MQNHFFICFWGTPSTSQLGRNKWMVPNCAFFHLPLHLSLVFVTINVWGLLTLEDRRHTILQSSVLSLSLTENQEEARHYEVEKDMASWKHYLEGWVKQGGFFQWWGRMQVSSSQRGCILLAYNTTLTVPEISTSLMLLFHSLLLPLFPVLSLSLAFNPSCRCHSGSSKLFDGKLHQIEEASFPTLTPDS